MFDAVTAVETPTLAVGSDQGIESHFRGARVLVVDDEPMIHQIIQRLFEDDGYIVQHAGNGTEALSMIKASLPDVVVADIMMPGIDGFEFCRRLRANPQTALLPVLILSSLTSTDDKVRGLDSGADEYLTKPFQATEMRARLRAILRTAFLRRQVESAEKVIFSLACAVEAKDAYTAGHIERVSSLVVEIGKQLKFGDEMCAQLQRGGILHDIGKIGVPDCILNKPGKFSDQEFEHIKRHPDMGERICRSLRSLQPVLDVIRHHHERLDGTGYPDGLSHDQISMPARIMAVCDVYDALTSDRPYRAAMARECALEVLDGGVAAKHWDGDVVAVLRRIVKDQSETVIHAP